MGSVKSGGEEEAGVGLGLQTQPQLIAWQGIWIPRCECADNQARFGWPDDIAYISHVKSASRPRRTTQPMVQVICLSGFWSAFQIQLLLELGLWSDAVQVGTVSSWIDMQCGASTLTAQHWVILYWVQGRQPSNPQVSPP